MAAGRVRLVAVGSEVVPDAGETVTRHVGDGDAEGGASMTDETVPRREFERVVAEHERRLDGHDTLYEKVQEAEKALVSFTETLKHARVEIEDMMKDRTDQEQYCERVQKGFNERLRVLEKFRWQIVGVGSVFVAAPAWVGLFMMLTGGE